MALIEQNKKPWYLSKTLWMQVLAIVAVIVPASGKIIQEYFTEAGIGWALINMVLRLISKDKIEISAASFKITFLIPLLFAVSCGWLGGGNSDGEEPSTGGGYPDPARVCTQITEANKEQITAEYGRSCKVGDFLSKGAPTCSSTLEKCMKKVY